jgi:hypothetical protein
MKKNQEVLKNHLILLKILKLKILQVQEKFFLLLITNRNFKHSLLILVHNSHLCNQAEMKSLQKIQKQQNLLEILI